MVQTCSNIESVESSIRKRDSIEDRRPERNTHASAAKQTSHTGIVA